MKKFQPDQKCLSMSRDEVRAFDTWAINEIGVPGIVLMENAGRSCAQFIIETLSKIKKPKVCIFCGTDNGIDFLEFAHDDFPVWLILSRQYITGPVGEVPYMGAYRQL